MALKEASKSWSDIHSRKNRRYRRIVIVSASIASFAVLVAVAWGIIYSPVFMVKSIDVSGNDHVSSGDIISFVKAKIRDGSWMEKILGADNIIAWPKSFSGNELKLMPEVSSVSINKDYFHGKITISVKERQPYGAWCLVGASQAASDIQDNPTPYCFWFDENGIIFKRAAGMQGSIFTVVDDYSQKDLGIGSTILPEEFLSNAMSVFKAVSDSGLNVREIRLNDLSLEEMEVDTYASAPSDISPQDGPKIYFSLRFPADNTSDIIKSLMNEGGFDKLQYVDFRVENRVYYK